MIIINFNILGSKNAVHNRISSLCSSNLSTSVPQSQFRKWLQSSESELELLKSRITNSRNKLTMLQRLQADHQVLFLNYFNTIFAS